MNLSEEQVDEIFSLAKIDSISKKYRWPNKTVPYQLSMDHTKEQRDHIELALKTIESVSCVKFVRRNYERNYVEITASSLIFMIHTFSFNNLYNYFTIALR